MKPRFPRRPNFGPRSPARTGGDQGVVLTEEDERILDAAAARRWRERQDAISALGEQGDESVRLTEEDERVFDVAWGKVRERRQRRAAKERPTSSCPIEAAGE